MSWIKTEQRKPKFGVTVLVIVEFTVDIWLPMKN